jgi:hypothetical protein
MQPHNHHRELLAILWPGNDRSHFMGYASSSTSKLSYLALVS